MLAFAKLIGVSAAVLLLLGLLVAPRASAQEPETNSIALELIGAKVFGTEGAEIGEVSAVTVGADGQIDEVRMTTDRSLGFGEKVVVLPRGSFIDLRGAIVLDRSVFARPPE